MAKPTQQETEIAELIRRSEASRLRLSDAHAALKDRMDVSARLKESLKTEPAKWLGGSLVAGFVASRLFRPRRKSAENIPRVKKQRNFLFGTLALATTLAKPAAKIYATKLVKDYLKKHLENASARRPVSGGSPRY
jgi:hypothetical protein